MKKLEFFLRAMKAECYRHSAWVISAFSLVLEGPDDWKSSPSPYRIVSTPTGYFFIDPDKNGELTALEDATTRTTPLFDMKETVQVSAGVIENLTQDITTTYGRILFNYIGLIQAFGSKIEFMNERISASKLEGIIADRLVDDAEEATTKTKTVHQVTPDTQLHVTVHQPPKEEPIFVSEYLKFADAMMSLTAYTQLCVPAVTEKSITPPPGIIEYRNKLLEENKDRLHDPAVIAKIDAQLVQYLRDYLKDDPAMGFLISNKSFDVVRKELYLMSGANAAMDDSGRFDLVTRSLHEGWDPEHFDLLNTSSRSGSFSRGAETEKGGEETKWLFRASSNMGVRMNDCGSQLGVDVYADSGQERRFIGFTTINDDGSQTKITKENVDQYLGKVIRLRSSMFCRAEKTDFCEICVGDRLAATPTGLATAVAAYGSTFMGMAMSAMHGTALKTTHLDWQRELQ